MGSAILMTATQPMTAADAWREVVQRGISLTRGLDGRVWAASIELKGDTRATRKRNVKAVSATASSPIGAIRELIAKLDAEAEQIDFVY
jgi:hypothetical protein